VHAHGLVLSKIYKRLVLTIAGKILLILKRNKMKFEERKKADPIVRPALDKSITVSLLSR